MQQFEQLRRYLERDDRGFGIGRHVPITKNLLNQVILPALYKIAQELEPYYHVKVSATVNKAFLKVFEEFDLFFKIDASNDKKGYIGLLITADSGIFAERSAHPILRERLVLAGDNTWIENKIIEKFTDTFITRDKLIEPFATEEVREFTKHHNEIYYPDPSEVS